MLQSHLLGPQHLHTVTQQQVLKDLHLYQLLSSDLVVGKTAVRNVLLAEVPASTPRDVSGAVQ